MNTEKAYRTLLEEAEKEINNAVNYGVYFRGHKVERFVVDYDHRIMHVSALLDGAGKLVHVHRDAAQELFKSAYQLSYAQGLKVQLIPDLDVALGKDVDKRSYH